MKKTFKFCVIFVSLILFPVISFAVEDFPFHMFQGENTYYCGEAAVGTMLAYKGVQKSLDDLVTLRKTFRKNEGTYCSTLKKLSILANEPLTCGYSLKEAFEKMEQGTPIIFGIKHHWLVGYKMVDGVIYFKDPAFLENKTYTMTKKELSKQYSLGFLYFEDEEGNK